MPEPPLQLHVALVDDVEHAARRETQRGDDGQRHERERHERIDPARNAEGKGLLLGVFERLVDLDERRFAHDAGDLELDLAEDPAAVHHDDAAAKLDHAVDRRGHVLLVRADDDDVVAVVRDGGRHRAGFEPVALDVADADVVRVLVALDDGDLQNIVFNADLLGVACVGRDDLAGDHAEHGARAGLDEVRGLKVRDMERFVRALDKVRVDLGRFKGCDALSVEHEPALLVDLENVEIVEVVDHDEVREEARRDRAAVVEQEVARGVVACALDGDDRIDARLNGPAHDVVDVPLFEQVVGVLIVGTEHAVGVVLRREQGEERVKVARGRALADHDVLSALELGERVLYGAAFVVGVNAGGDVGIQIIARETGGVAVNLLVVRLRGHDLFKHLLVTVRHADVVHHLGKALDAVVLVERVDRAVVEHRAGFVERRRGHAGGEHEAYVHGQVLGRLEHVLDAVGPHDVRNLVRVGDDGGRAVRNDGVRKLLGGDERALKMDVRIDKAGQNKLAAHVDLRFALVVLAHAGDQALRHGDVAMAQLVAEYVYIRRVFEHEVGLLPA